MIKEKAVVILSGGLDSTTLLYDVKNQGYDVYALSFNYNQKHKKELQFAKMTCKKMKISHKIIDLKVLNDIAPSALTRNIEMPEGNYMDENMKITVVPNRNMVMISLAASYSIGIGCKKIFYGAHSGDHTIYPDCRPEFIKAMKDALKICDWNEVKLLAPYEQYSKMEIVDRGTILGVDYSLTWTCYNGGKLACGKCGSCMERLEAFERNSIKDPLKYKKE